jgi:MFS family permease
LTSPWGTARYAAFTLLAAVQVSLIAAITLITVALPVIGSALRVGDSDLALITAAYGLAFGGLLMLGGRLADLAGHRRMFVLGVVVFGGGSAIAGGAPGLDVLIAARFVTGAGAALAAPAAMALLGAVFPEPVQRRRVVALWGTLSGIGAAAGTVLSGVIVTWASWRWTLLLPAAVAVVAVPAAFRVLPSVPARRVRLDVPGALLVTAGFSTVSYALIADPGAGLLAAGIVLLAGFAVAEAITPVPLVPLRFLARRSLSFVTVLLASAGTATVSFFLVLYFQQVRGFSPLRTSAAFVPYCVALLVTGLVSGRLVGRFGARAVTVIGLATAAIGLALVGRLGVATPYAGYLLAGLLVLPLGVGLAFAGAFVSATDGVDPDQAGMAAGVINTAMEAGPTVGLAVAVALANARQATLRAGGHGTAAAASGGYGFALTVAAVAFAVLAGVAGVGFSVVTGRRNHRTFGIKRF